jgi:hypothetical protein
VAGQVKGKHPALRVKGGKLTLQRFKVPPVISKSGQ